MADVIQSPEKSFAEEVQTSVFRDAIYKELSKINGRINKMSRKSVIHKLRQLNLISEGSTDVLRKRLKHYYKEQKLKTANLIAVSKLYPFYVVIDFEATCEVQNTPTYKHEIIEFPALLLDTEKQQVIDQFHHYCKPIVNPNLSPFCVELTGIQQEQVDQADEFSVVLTKFEEWLKKHKLGSKYKFAIVADGPWDMGRFLYGQCLLSGIPYPEYAKTWVNMRKTFSNFYKCRKFCLKLMLEFLHMEFEGRPHCGLDDARNITNILLHLMADGASLLVNERIIIRSADNKNNMNFSHMGDKNVVAINKKDSENDFIKVRRERSKYKSLKLDEFQESEDDETDSEVTKDPGNSEELCNVDNILKSASLN